MGPWTSPSWQVAQECSTPAGVSPAWAVASTWHCVHTRSLAEPFLFWLFAALSVSRLSGVESCMALLPWHQTRCHGSKAMHDSTPLNLLTLSAAKSQNKKGSARDRVCTQCHVEATAHAGDTPAGVDHSCATCHEGEVHGPITSPEVQRCMDCHGAADKHALQHDCKRCHWPAIHNGTPDAGVGGGQKKMKLYLPAGSAGGVTDSGRTRLVDTGADLIPIALAGILLLGSGIYRNPIARF